MTEDETTIKETTIYRQKQAHSKKGLTHKTQYIVAKAGTTHKETKATDTTYCGAFNCNTQLKIKSRKKHIKNREQNEVKKHSITTNTGSCKI